MEYEIITHTNTVDDVTTSHVIISREDGSFESFPVDEANPRYIQFLEETK